MSKLKSTLVIVGLVLSCLTAMARPVDPEKAGMVALNFWNAHRDKGVAALGGPMQRVALPFDGMYLFAAGETGFVLVAADDRVQPILGYSFTSPAGEELHPEVRYWLESYQRQIEDIAAGGRWPVASKRHPDWELYARAPQGEPVPLTAVSPLLTTTWDQGPYYNDQCPYDASASSYYSYRAPTGCVATATAQIMKYHSHPTTGYGSHSYSHSSYGTLSANFGSTTYAWSSMPNALTSASSSSQKNAVATLMYHVGVADEMNYGPYGSGAKNYNYYGSLSASSQTALMQYFKYRPDMAALARADYSDAAYAALLKAELDASRPILFSGSNTAGGHSFVLDGYNSSSQFHINWGWGGSYDGYFAMGSLNPMGGGTGGSGDNTYNLDNVALIGIRPNTNWSSSGTTTVSVSAGTGGTVSGGGSYAFGDTITLTATANAGYRFSGWNDGSKFNNRAMLATGGSYSFTAAFEPVSGDTLHYCPGNFYISAYRGYGSSTVWGIKLPQSILDASDTLTAVQLFVAASGSYNLTVYTGASHSTTAATASVSYTSADEDQWRTITLGTPVPATQDIWIVFSYSGSGYPASYTYGSGVAHSFLWASSLYEDGIAWNATAMIKGIFSGSTGGTGGGGSTDDCLITAFPYTESFDNEDTYGCLFIYDANDDGESWGLIDSFGTDYSRAAYIMYAVDADDWLVLPGIKDAGNYSISWKTRAYNASYPESYEVYIGDSMVYSETLTSTSLVTRSASFSVAEGDTVSPMFRYISDDQYAFFLDDITISQASAPVQYTLTVTSNNPAWGTVTGGGTYAAGTTAIIGATPNSGYHFVQWQDGNTSATRSVIVTANATYTATFAANPVEEPCVVSDFPYSESFEGGIDCWTATDGNGDSFTWRTLSSIGEGSEAVTPHTGSVMVGSFSWNSAAMQADEYLISPAFELPDGSVSLSFWFRVNSNFPEDKLAVKLSTTGNATSNFTTTLVDITPTAANGSWTQQTVDLSAYAGQTVYIAFHHHDSYDNNYVVLDDISISQSTAPVQYTLTVTSNNPAWGTVSGGGTYDEGTTVTLAATPNSGYRFVQWQDGNTNASRTVTVTANATYTATFAPNEGIDGIAAGQWVLYPNPADDAVRFSGMDHAVLTVTDLAGRIVATHTVADGDLLDVSAWPSGTYFFTIVADGMADVRKIIIKH